MRSFLLFLFAIAPFSAQAYMPPPSSLLGAVMDPELDPLVIDQLMQEDPIPTEEDAPEDTTWEEDAATWEAENDPLVLDESIFDENGNWIDVMDMFETTEVTTQEQTAAPAASHQAAPAQAAAPAPAFGSNGKPVLYRGGKVFEPGAAFHAAAEEEPAPAEPAPEAVEEEPMEAELVEPLEATGSVAGEIETLTGAVLDEATASGSIAEKEKAMPEETAEEEESSWLGGSIMTIALAAGAIGLGVMLLLFKGKIRGSGAKAAPAQAVAAPAAPQQEESKLQHAIDEMKGKQ